jgi:hypothetical protein
MTARWCLLRPGTARPHRGLPSIRYLVAPLTSRSRRDPCVRRSLATFVSIQLLFARFDNTVHTFVSCAPRILSTFLPAPPISLITPLDPE